MIGPALQAVGLVVVVAHILARHLHDPLAPRHMVFEPGFLIVFVGFLVSFVCIPVAIDVARARQEDVAIPLFGPSTEGEAREALASPNSRVESETS